MLEEKIATDSSRDLITQTISLVSTKKREEADIIFSIANDSDNKVKFIDVPKDVNLTHPYSAKEAILKIQESLNLSLGIDHGFTSASFTNICKDRKLKENQAYYYVIKYGQGVVQKYSEKLIEQIVYLYSKNEDVRECYRRKTPSQNKKINPGQDDFSAI